MPAAGEWDDEVGVASKIPGGPTFVARDTACRGFLAVTDPVRAHVDRALPSLRALGIRRIVLASGDSAPVTHRVAQALGITEIHAACLPHDKIAVVQSLQAQGHVVAVVGDGVNDAPALVQADVGIAMGMAGSDIATDAADVVVMQDDWDHVVEAIRVGRRTARAIRQNIGIGIGWNVVTLGLASTGVIGPVIAAASEAMPDVLVALNALRLYWGHQGGSGVRPTAVAVGRAAESSTPPM